MSKKKNYVTLSMEGTMSLISTHRRERLLMYGIMKYCEKDDTFGYLFTNNAITKKKIIMDMNWERTETVDNGLVKLTKEGFINRIAHGVYQINPDIVINVC